MQPRYTLSSELQVAKHAECTRLFYMFLCFSSFAYLLILFAPLFELGRFYHFAALPQQIFAKEGFPERSSRSKPVRPTIG